MPHEEVSFIIIIMVIILRISIKCTTNFVLCPPFWNRYLYCFEIFTPYNSMVRYLEIDADIFFITEPTELGIFVF